MSKGKRVRGLGNISWLFSLVIAALFFPFLFNWISVIAGSSRDCGAIPEFAVVTEQGIFLQCADEVEELVSGSLVGSIEWSPDGRYLAYAISEDSQGSRLFIVDAETKIQRPILETIGVWSINPKWSVDGRYIAFIHDNAEDFNEPLNPDLWVVEVESGEWNRISGNVDSYDWSDQKLYYVIEEQGMYFYEPEEVESTRYSNDPRVENLIISPSGQYMGFYTANNITVLLAGIKPMYASVWDISNNQDGIYWSGDDNSIFYQSGEYVVLAARKEGIPLQTFYGANPSWSEGGLTLAIQSESVFVFYLYNEQSFLFDQMTDISASGIQLAFRQ